MTNQIARLPHRSPSLDDQVRELAGGLRDVLRDTPDSSFEEEPESVYFDLACRLILQLSGKLKIVPVLDRRAEIDLHMSQAASRIFEIFDEWIATNPGCSHEGKIVPDGRFELVLRSPQGACRFFGHSARDAYAQAAQTLRLNGGTLWPTDPISS